MGFNYQVSGIENPVVIIPDYVIFIEKSIQNEPEGTPETLFKVGALLIKRGIIDLHVLYSHLGPTYEEMKAEYNKRLSDAREKVKHTI